MSEGEWRGTVASGIECWFGQRSGLERVALVLAAGLLSGFAFAPHYLLPVLAISYPLLLLVLFTSRNTGDAFFFGWWFGFGQFFVGTIWIATAFGIDGRYPAWTGYLAVAALAVLLALFAGAATALLWKLFHKEDRARQGLSIVVMFAVLWTLAEWLRGHLFTGFPWNLSGYVWGFSDVMLQSAALWGIYGLSLVTLFLALVPYLVIHALDRTAHLILISAAVVLLLGGLAAYGALQLATPTAFNHDVKLKIIQANISQADKWDSAQRSANFVKYLRMSKSSPAAGITHVIWPETAVVYFIHKEPSRRHIIADMLSEGSMLMTGFPRVERRPEFQAWNSLAVIDSAANVTDIYDKQHLVPFGEYTPGFLSDSLSFLGLGMLVEGFSYSKGDGPRTLHPADTPPVGVLICYEVIFPGDVVDADDRPDWLLNVTNDAWFGTFNGPYQHLLQTRVRAIEEGLPLVRSAGTGISAVIDAYGRIVKSVGLNRQGVIISHLPVKRDALTFYSTKGDWTFLGLVILFGGMVFLSRRQRHRRLQHNA